jgi:hypothetical protein
MSIVVFGSINMDLVVRAPHIPIPGETILGSDFVMVPGGKGANQAVGLVLSAPMRLAHNCARVWRIMASIRPTCARAMLPQAWP